MASNDWINSYLEAILDVGPGLVDDAKSSLLLRERGHFSPTRYFVEEVITGFDETDLHRSWVRAAATRSPQERNTRLENLCWRIWNLARQKKQLEGEEAQRMAKRRIERERGRREATADMSEDLSEGEKGDVVSDISAHGDNSRARLPRINSVDTMEMWISQQKGKKLYIVLISLHGLIRGENMELGRDSDTGGQVKYVVELARALGTTPGVYRVDLLTRQVSSPDVDWSYGEPTEMLTPINADGFAEEMGESSGSYIIRIPFGPKDKYIPKEELWPHIPEFVDGALNHIIQMSKVLGEQIGGGKPVWPVAIHGHYADAGDSAALLSGALNVPMLFTGHSLGRDKLEQLLKQGRLSRDEINTTYKIMRRIEAEELALDSSEIVITSTRQEIEEQWRLYDGFDPILERKLRARIRRNVSCYGRFMPRMVIIPPGMEFHHIVPQDGDMDGETEANEDHPTAPDPPIWSEIMRFFTNPRKPMILALARPDPKKNITTLVKAFGECRPLRELANLTLIMGNRDGIDEMSGTSSSVLLSVLKLIDKHDLYGQVAYPKHHKQSDVPEIYRLAAKTKGVFINPAFIEPFGLTLIEAAAHGLPIVATKNGGPVDIHQVLDNGLLVDPHDQQSIADALLKLVADKQLWARCRQNGLKNIHLFSWPEHCKTYLSRIASCKPRHPQWQRSEDGAETSESDSPSDSLRDIQDLSLNLKFSLDGEKSGTSVNDSSSEYEGNTADRRNKIENAVLAWSKGISRDTRKAGFSEKADHNSAGKFPVLRRRKHLIVIAVDCDTITDLIETTRKIFEATGKERSEGSVGFILSTSLTISEISSFLVSGGLSPNDFDAFICNSGSDLYYPSIHSEERPFVVDFYYHSHIEYRWGGEGLRKTLVRWAGSVNDKKTGSVEQIVTAADQLSTDYCYAFKVQKPGKVPPVKELRKLLETWYNQFMERYRISKPYRLSSADRESEKRTPEEMSAYLKLLERHKKRRLAFKEDQYMGYGNPILENVSHMNPNSVLDGSNSVDSEISFFPETMFTFNCVPDSALPPLNREEDNQKVECYGVLDMLPQIMTRSPVMLERLGIRPEYLSMEQGGILHRGKNGSGGNRKCLSKEQAAQLSQTVIARMLTSIGFESATEVPIDVFSQMLSCHISKLGGSLKVLTDSYRKQCSAIELLKMFLQTIGYSNFGPLMEQVKDGSRNFQQTQQQIHGSQSQLQPQHQNPIRLPQQTSRQMLPQMQQVALSKNVPFQQQQPLERMRRRQPSTPRAGMDMDKDRPMVQVKIEAPSELPMDGNAFYGLNNRNLQMQFRQQIPAMSNLTMPNVHPQSGNQFRQMASLQIPQMQAQNAGVLRAPPVKVEGFQELMGGDASSKHDSDENRLTSPISK